MGKRKMYQSTTISKVNPETGELEEVEQIKDFVVKVDTEHFYMCFFEKMASFYGIKHLSDMKLMVSMCELAEFNTGIVHMTRKTRQRLCEQSGITITNLSRNLNRLIAIDLISYDEGDYTINPQVFWKGELKKRKELLEIDGLKFTITLVE